AGTVTNDTKHSIHLTKEASKLGIAGILAVGPYYNRPSQAGILAHMKAVCAATTLPVVVYDIPVRTGRKISTASLAKLANEVKNVAALKDASGNPAETAMLMTQVPKSFELLSGDDGLTLPLMSIGATGVIGVSTNWNGVDHQEMFKKWNSGDIAGARAVNSRMLESFAFETGDDNPNPLPSKVMMNHLGLDVGEARLPMGPPPSGLAELAQKQFSNLQAARPAATKKSRNNSSLQVCVLLSAVFLTRLIAICAKTDLHTYTCNRHCVDLFCTKCAYLAYACL
ncbi:MAG: dihydrodipicolinate synthase family protein, partial [Acidimicrobiaceae bacterium]